MTSKDKTATERIETPRRGTLLESAMRLGLISTDVRVPSEPVVELYSADNHAASPTYVTRLSANAET